MKVSIQGQVASYSHIAIKNLFDNLKLDLFFRDSFVEVFKDIEEELVEFGLLPVQNSTYGHITEVWDGLGNFNVNIISEIYVKVNFHLISFLGNKLDNIKFVYSHPVALKQVKRFLERNPQIKSFEYTDTAGSVKFIQESFNRDKNKNEYAAIASREAANVYRMHVIQENIQDNLQNYTRFLLLKKGNRTREKLQTYENVKYTLAIRVVNGYKSLIEVLKLISLNNGNLINLLGRPILNTKWEELFFLDIKFLSFVDYQKFLKVISAYVVEIKQLGVYQEGNIVNS